MNEQQILKSSKVLIKFFFTDKSSEIWWKQLLVNEENLDLKQMDCSRPLEDLSEDAQAAVSKLQWDEHQKILGL